MSSRAAGRPRDPLLRPPGGAAGCQVPAGPAPLGAPGVPGGASTRVAAVGRGDLWEVDAWTDRGGQGIGYIRRERLDSGPSGWVDIYISSTYDILWHAWLTAVRPDRPVQASRPPPPHRLRPGPSRARADRPGDLPTGENKITCRVLVPAKSPRRTGEPGSRVYGAGANWRTRIMGLDSENGLASVPARAARAAAV